MNLTDAKRVSSLTLLALLLLALPALAQKTAAQKSAPTPDTHEDIFLVEVQNNKGRLAFGRPTNITNRAGYDNQPAFLPDGQSLLYTSQREGQTDIYRYNLRDRSTTQLTRTPESEYSPTPTPDGKFFSVVRVEQDKTQRLWKFPLAGGDVAPTLVLPDIKPVGYHLWLDRQTLALFVLGTEGKPNRLEIVPIDMKFLDTIHVNIGRSLQMVPHQQKFSYVHKLSPDEWLINIFDIKAHHSATITRTLPHSEDLTWTNGGTILMASDAKLFQYDPAQPDADWHEVADFSYAGLKHITRLALNPKGDRLALVAQVEARD